MKTPRYAKQHWKKDAKGNLRLANARGYLIVVTPDHEWKVGHQHPDTGQIRHVGHGASFIGLQEAKRAALRCVRDDERAMGWRK